jgi:hypothetical protein
MSAIHSRYRTLFTIIDPIIATWGTYLFFFQPDTVIDSFVPIAHAPRNPAHDFVLVQVGAHLLACALLSVFALRLRPDDVPLWKIVQASYLTVDVLYIGGTLSAFAGQGRLSPLLWRAADWGCMSITGSLGAARTAFLLGVGMPAVKSD